MVRVKNVVSNKGFGGPNISFEEGKHTVIDNFLEYEQFKGLKEAIVFNDKFPFSPVKTVTSKRKKIKDIEDKRLWSWYMLHLAYENDMPVSEFAQPLMELFSPRFVDLGIIKSLSRVKINMFPYTHEVHEHEPHKDRDYPIKNALFSLNTCDGFTRLSDGSKIESVENRIVFFDGSFPHNSSTTSNAEARFNINFNFF